MLNVCSSNDWHQAKSFIIQFIKNVHRTNLSVHANLYIYSLKVTSDVHLQTKPSTNATSLKMTSDVHLQTKPSANATSLKMTSDVHLQTKPSTNATSFCVCQFCKVSLFISITSNFIAHSATYTGGQYKLIK